MPAPASSCVFSCVSVCAHFVDSHFFPLLQWPWSVQYCTHTTCILCGGPFVLNSKEIRCECVKPCWATSTGDDETDAIAAAPNALQVPRVRTCVYHRHTRNYDNLLCSCTFERCALDAHSACGRVCVCGALKTSKFFERRNFRASLMMRDTAHDT